ncbi:tRNA:m(4)X modification enzyme TRM13 homolog [Saccostrea cucullata]|uniref:tRNA:m(4)X modification enzyme TRM13 homolog n=1 Tax=Saccostrea cuccullata TaxID=36930 RepID=UPI002ED66631
MVAKSTLFRRLYSVCMRHFSSDSMSFKFSANLAFMFSEFPSMVERYDAAKAAGFKYVESAFPYLEPLESVQNAIEKSGLEQVLINAWPGDLSKGDLGIAALPDRQEEFESKLNLTLEYAKALKCKRIHVMAGMKPNNFDETEMEKTFIKNITLAAKRFEPEGITCVIEPLNSRITAPRYFLTDINKAVEIIKKINRPNLKLQFDFFHVQIMEGNLTKTLEKYLPYVGHIQIAQVPDRGEPDRQGEINYTYVFELLQKLKYDGYIGLEYKPRGNTVEGLKWLKDYGLQIDQGRERIPCPINPKHTCYKDSVEKHLKKCRKQQKELPIPLKDFSTKELQDLIEKVHKLYDEHVTRIDEEILSHHCLDEELSNESYGIPAIRHRKQQASLVGQLQRLDLLHEGLCFVELGAGKGNLSHWIQQALPDKSDLGFVLVDYGHVRYKADNKHKWSDTGPKFERLCINIADLNLEKVESISANQRPVVAVGKHLCGGATDFALRCVTKTLNVQKFEERTSQPEEKKFKSENHDSHPRPCLAGITIALCCHHRCTWETYVGKEFIKNCGLSHREFTLLCKLSGWTAATWTGWKTKEEMYREINRGNSSIDTECKTENKNNADNVSDERDSSSQTEDKNTTVDQSINSNDFEEHQDSEQPFSRSDLQLSASQREEIGRKCKRLIDIGRVHYLRNCGLQSQLKTYIEEKLTPENVIIVAKSQT